MRATWTLAAVIWIAAAAPLRTLGPDASQSQSADEGIADACAELERLAAESAWQACTCHPVQLKAVRSWLKGLDRGQTLNGLWFLNLMYFGTLSKE